MSSSHLFFGLPSGRVSIGFHLYTFFFTILSSGIRCKYLNTLHNQRSLRRTDHSSRGILPSVVCLWSRSLGNEEAVAHYGLLRYGGGEGGYTYPFEACSLSEHDLR